jgi:hypothetical protein
MKIASGLEAMPDIYIIDDPALNAFATGRDSKKASVAVTSGLLQRLNRDELQGVIAHELGHIKNRDVLLMAICGVLLGTIVILSWYASRIMIFGGLGGSRRSSSSGGGGAQLIILAVALVLMILAPIAAQFIYFAISRSGAIWRMLHPRSYPLSRGLASHWRDRRSQPYSKSANKHRTDVYLNPSDRSMALPLEQHSSAN